MRTLDESVSLLQNANLLARASVALANYKIGKRCNDFIRLESACSQYSYDSYVAQKLMEADIKVKEGIMKYHTSEEIIIKLDELLNEQNQYRENSEVTSC